MMPRLRRTTDLLCREAHPAGIWSPVVLEESGKKNPHSAYKLVPEATHAVYLHHHSRGFTAQQTLFHSENDLVVPGRVCAICSVNLCCHFFLRIDPDNTVGLHLLHAKKMHLLEILSRDDVKLELCVSFRAVCKLPS